MDDKKGKPANTGKPDKPDEGGAPTDGNDKKAKSSGDADKAPQGPKETEKQAAAPVGGEEGAGAAKEPKKVVPGEGDSKPPAKPVAKPAAKPPARRPARGPAYEDLEDDPLLTDLRRRFPNSELSGQTFLGQAIYTVPVDILYDAMLWLRDRPELSFDYLVDLTALDYLPETPRFCLVYQLFSYPEGPLIRVKSRIQEAEYAPSVASIWATADWLEREVFDMFGIEFSGHPDLRRILLPEDWHGFPLRKDYDIKLQDQAWIRKHLRIRKVPG